MNTTIQSILPGAKMVLALSDMLLVGVEPERFARFPTIDGQPVRTNHPAFIYGHLSLYPAQVMQLLGLDAQGASVPESYASIFKAGAECVDDVDGSVYPSMEEIVSAFKRSHSVLIEALPGVEESVLAQQTPDEKRRERMPTIGSVVSFIVGPHAMMHLGQLSAWRRCMGLPSAM